MKKTYSLILLAAAAGMTLPAAATPVRFILSNVSPTARIAAKGSTRVQTLSDGEKYTYDLDMAAGKYELTAYGKDGSTVNGTIDITINDQEETQEFKILTCTAYVSNKTEDDRTWTADDGDYALDVRVSDSNGNPQSITIGNSVTAGRKTFLAINGNSYYAAFEPSDAHKAEGYTTLYKGATLTFNATVSGKIPLAEDYVVTVPKGAEFQMGMKLSHFVDFTPVAYKSRVNEGEVDKITYSLAQGQVYNYRTWIEGKLTQAGHFTMSADAEKRPELNFTAESYDAFNPATINHDVTANNGYETGDIFVNANYKGHLEMNVGEVRNAHAMRSWELTDSAVGNYFIEPDFHYTILDLDGNPCDDVLTVNQKPGSAWAELTAVGAGTAIVLVTYDGIAVDTYSGATRNPIMGGEFWGAIWPENTAAYVVTVGQKASTVVPNTVINQEFNKNALKMAGPNVDAEHDVFYYLDTEAGHVYTFKPENVAEMTIAYPVIGERSATYEGFTADGVTANEDGSYSILLKEGRQIVRMVDAAGNAAYQVITAKKCHREITNVTNPDSEIMLPGDEISIQYSGLRHPANKLAGIYNMSSFVTYQGVPEGVSLTLGSAQYNFGSTPKAQNVTFTIPEEIDITEQHELLISEGVIQVNGFGDPIGNHRYINPVAGRSPNFQAVAHKTYFGYVPDVELTLGHKIFTIEVACNVPDAEITLTRDGEVLTPAENGTYQAQAGTFILSAQAPGYYTATEEYTLTESDVKAQKWSVELKPDYSGVNNLESVAGEAIYYSPDGVGSAVPRQGLNIVRLSDGTYRKVMKR